MGGVEALERGFVKAGPASGCARCCGVCPVAACPLRQSLTGEFGKKAKVRVVGSIEELFSKKSPGLRDGTFIFGPARQGSGEPPIRTREKTCSICQKAASDCDHSKSKTSASSAA